MYSLTIQVKAINDALMNEVNVYEGLMLISLYKAQLIACAAAAAAAAPSFN